MHTLTNCFRCCWGGLLARTGTLDDYHSKPRLVVVDSSLPFAPFPVTTRGLDERNESRRDMAVQWIMLDWDKRQALNGEMETPETGSRLRLAYPGGRQSRTTSQASASVRKAI